MTYRAPGKDPLTDWGRFIVRRRRELDWSATQAFEAVREGLRLSAKSRTAYLPFEYDREPDEREASILEGVFGGRPTDEDTTTPKPAPPDLGALVTSNYALTDAINALVGRLDRLTDEQAGGLRDLAEAIGDLARQATHASTQAGSGDGAPRPSAA